MLLPSLSSLVTTLAVSGTLAGGTPASAPRLATDTLPFDTTQVVVTTNDFANLSAFLTATLQEWNKPAMVGLMKRHLLTYKIAFAPGVNGAALQGNTIQIPNYIVIADSTPSVAQGLAKGKLTGSHYLQLSRTLNCAFISDQIDALSHNGKGTDLATTTVTGKNVAFIRAHKAEFDQLVKNGLDVTPLQASGGGMGGGDDLSP